MFVKRIIYISILLLSFIWVGAQNQETTTIRKPIALDQRALSGLDLKRVKNAQDPDRILNQKKLLWGDDLGIFIVSSETKSVHWDGYGMEEFIYVINGRARLKSDNGKERFYNPGDFFMVPLGYQGEWETQGAKSFYYELSVIATDRSDTEVNANQIKPFALSSEDLSGVNLPEIIPENGYDKRVFEGVQLTMDLCAENPSSRTMAQTKEDVLIYIIAGSLDLEDVDGENHIFYSGDFLLLPKGFVGTWNSEGHDVFRYLKVMSSKKA